MFEKQIIKSLIHPPKDWGFGGIKKAADKASHGAEERRKWQQDKQLRAGR